MSEVQTLTITEFLTARLDEDEAAARNASGAEWEVDDQKHPEAIYADFPGAVSISVVSGSRWSGEASVFDNDADAHHIARWDPARVLAEVEVKRTLIRWLNGDQIRNFCGYAFGDLAIRVLVRPYVDHPDCREEWKS